MATERQEYPQHAVLTHPDGGRFIYAQASEDLQHLQQVEVNTNGRLTKFKGGMRFPSAIITETVPKEWWTFVMVNPPRPAQEKPVIG